ncbi:hypothetical protein P9273_28710 [Mesorhizobium sp. WSM4935]|uniref:hypothetical protein n=1 Tax=Mesorhizobium sp. WSM4935 TaxID=3038547 RepID=UPI0024151956|nr:hypothetical protein [Mesorhizobium sp. WSM4935]MDG4879062.1 hypothetical protein [Mesorhizobium sp. WSM4935]
MSPLGSGGEPLLRRLLIERQTLARLIQRSNYEHRTDVNLGGGLLEQMRQGER